MNRQERREAVAGRLDEAWAALDGARQLANNNGLTTEADEIAGVGQAVDTLQRQLNRDPKRHWHTWRAGAHGPCEGRVGQYAQCDGCEAQVFIGDDDQPAIYFHPPDRHPRELLPRDAFTFEAEAA